MRRTLIRKLPTALVLGLAVALLAGPAAAQTPQVDANDPIILLDNAFVFLCGALVIFMQAGFALVEVGMTRAKNAAHMVLKNLLDFAVGATAFAVFGYHIAFSGAAYLGFDWLWGGPLDAATVAPNLTMPVHFFFNVGFAAAAATIVSGAVAERINFRAYFIYAFLISAFIYPTVVNWAWGGGWLSELSTPFIDLAGSTVVHVTGGIAALVAAVIVGPRIGRFDEDGNSTPIPGHNLPLAITGVFILLIGWFGFNAGSLLGADLHIGIVAAISVIGAATGGLGAAIASWLTLKTPDVTLIGTGVLGGLVGVTAGVANISFFGAIIIGLVSGVIANNGALLLDRLRVDDPAGAVPVHLFCGVWGTIALGFLADPDAAIGGDGPAGLLYGGSASLLFSQVAGVLAITLFVGTICGIAFMVMHSMNMTRVSPEVEAVGMDIGEHSTPAYSDDVVEGEGEARDELEELLDELTVA